MIIKDSSLITTSTSHFLGKRNVRHEPLAASAVSELKKIRKKTIRESLIGTRENNYRLQKVLKQNGVTYINDSGATTLNGAYYALKTTQSKIVWIAGGDDMEVDYKQLLPLVNEKVVALIAIGVVNKKLIAHFDNCIDLICEAENMYHAVKQASQIAADGDTVLLSPACRGLDRFTGFIERGNQFNEAVRNL